MRLSWEGRASSRPRERGVPGMSLESPVVTARTKPGPPRMRFGTLSSWRDALPRVRNVEAPETSRDNAAVLGGPRFVAAARKGCCWHVPGEPCGHGPDEAGPSQDAVRYALQLEGRASSRPRERGVPGMSLKSPVDTARTKPGPPRMRLVARSTGRDALPRVRKRGAAESRTSQGTAQKKRRGRSRASRSPTLPGDYSPAPFWDCVRPMWRSGRS